MDSSVILEVTNTVDIRPTARHPWRFTWGRLRNGGRTMFEGATWSLRADGTATFEAIVNGARNGDRWVIWHVDLLDEDGFILGSLATEHPIEGDWRKFVIVMPHGDGRYRFHGCASFDPALWGALARLKMYLSC